MSETIRSFIAIELLEQIEKSLETIQSKLKNSGADVKWVKPQNIHLTLKFLGNRSPQELEEIKKILDEVAADFGKRCPGQSSSFNISLSEIGAFPRLNYPRVIWIGIKEGSQETTRLAEDVEQSLEKIGIPKEDRPFSPHLTLGRLRSPKGRERLKEFVEKLNSELGVTSYEQRVDHLTLFQSTLTPSGPIYTPLHKSKFQGQPLP